MKTWKDEKHKLEWQVEPPLDRMNWHHAIEYPMTLGNSWRLPRVEELETLLDRSNCSPAVREEVPFKDSLYYWSSTTYVIYANYAWYVHFSSGYVGYFNKNYRYYVRCVRDLIE